MRRRRRRVDDERAALVHAWFHWRVEFGWAERLGGPAAEPSRVHEALREAAGRLLSDDERDAVERQHQGNYIVARGAPLDRWPRPADEAVDAARERLEGEAGVRFVPGRGWTAGPADVAGNVRALPPRP